MKHEHLIAWYLPILKSTSCQGETETKLCMLVMASRANNRDQNTLKTGIREGQNEWHLQETEAQQVYLLPKLVQSS